VLDYCSEMKYRDNNISLHDWILEICAPDINWNQWQNIMTGSVLLDVLHVLTKDDNSLLLSI